MLNGFVYLLREYGVPATLQQALEFYRGMGKGLAAKFKTAAKVFQRANEIIGFDLASICFEGPDEVLTETQNAQPAG